MDNEFILQDRIQKIQQIISKYGDENFYISYSGGLDSNVLSALIDMAIPENKIPRVYADTGIELNAVRDFVKKKCAEDSRFEMIKPTVPIKKMLETDGYPFKSKGHSKVVSNYQKHGFKHKYTRVYLGMEKTLKGEDCYRPCPKMLKCQFTPDYNLKISDLCCKRLKIEPLEQWQKQTERKYGIVGVTHEEGGRRYKATCLLSARIKAKQNAAERMKQYLLDNMRKLSRNKIETSRAVISLRHNAESVNITDEGGLIDWAQGNHDEYLRYKEPEINKAAIKKALQQGEDIPGCRLERTQSVTIK